MGRRIHHMAARSGEYMRMGGGIEGFSYTDPALEEKASWLNFGKKFGISACQLTIIVLMSLPMMIVVPLAAGKMIESQFPVFVAAGSQLFSLGLFMYRSWISKQIVHKMFANYSTKYVNLNRINEERVMYDFSIWSYKKLESRHQEAYTIWLLEHA